MKRFTRYLNQLIVIAGTVTLGLHSALAAAESKPLRVGWVYAMANAPALIAEEKHFFADEGLTVDIKSFTDGAVLEKALATGELDIAYMGTPPVYQWYARGFDTRILAKVNYGQAAIIANASQNIKTLADLKGKKLASVAKGSGMDVLLRGFVLRQQARLDPDKDLNILPMPPGNMGAALNRHVVDAAFIWEPFISQALARGDSRLVFDVNQAIPHYPWYVIAAPVTTLKERPNDVVKLLRAHRKAIDFLRDKPDEADQIIAQAFHLEDIKRPDGKLVTAKTLVHDARSRLGWSDALDGKDIQFIQSLMDYSLQLGFISKPLKAAQIIDLTYWQKSKSR